MNTNTYALDSAEVVVTDWEDQITDDFGQAVMPYADEYQAPQSAWTAWESANVPQDIFDARPLTEWEMY